MTRHVRRRLCAVAGVVALVVAATGLWSTWAGAAPSAESVRSAAPAVASSAARASCASDGAYVWSHLKKCGWAGPATTGPKASKCPSGQLQPWGSSQSATISVTEPGTVIACRSITGCLSIEATGVTVRDVRIRCTSGQTGEDANGSAVITIQNGATALISRVRTDGLDGVHACVWHQGAAVKVRLLDCSHVNDGIFSWSDSGDSHTDGDRFEIRSSYFHDFTTATANGHIDGYQTEGASHGRLIHNTFLMTSDDDDSSDSAVAVWNGQRSSHDIAVRRNLIAGGGFAVYAEDYSPSEASPGGGYSVTGVQFTDNVFSTRLFGCVGYYGVWYPRGRPTDGWQRAGNRVLETGQVIDATNPSVQGQLCT